MPNRSVADQLLDAQVAYLLERVTGDALQDEVAAAVDDTLAALADVPLAELLDQESVTEMARRLIATVPASAGASTLVSAAAELIHDGPPEPFSPSEVIGREHVEAIVDESLRFTPVVQTMLDELAESPLVAALAFRFVARIVGDVLAANRSVAEKIPGVGGLVSFGAGAASKVMGAADKQLEALLGDTAGKGAAFAMRRLNKIIGDIAADPMTRKAAMQVWDTYADQPLVPPKAFMTREDTQRVAALVHEIVASGAPTDPIGGLIDRMIGVFFSQYGEHSLTVLLDDLDITRDDLVTDIGRLAPGIVEGLKRNGALEKAIRARLEPFFASEEVAAILG